MGILGIEIKDIGQAVGAVGGLAKDVRAAITGKAVVDPAAQAQLEAKILEIEQAANAAIQAVNQAEASSPSLFIAGARPAIMWIGALVILYSYIIDPILQACGVKTPPIQMGDLWPVITGMLGLGTMRTYEKSKGVVSQH